MGTRASLDILEKRKISSSPEQLSPQPSHYADCSIPVLLETYALQPHLPIKLEQAPTLTLVISAWFDKSEGLHGFLSPSRQILCYSLIIGQYHFFLHVLNLNVPYHAQSEATESKLQTA